MQCLNCYTGTMQKPSNDHVSYIECPNCGSIELLYEPQEYQEDIHNVPYLLNANGKAKVQIVGAFGGYGSGKSK